MEKGVLLLSGGIDSAVAGHMMKNRVELIAVAFHQVPLSDGKEIDKVKEIAKILGITKLYLIPFTDVLTQLVERCEHRHYFVLQKIMMFKTAEAIAKDEGARFLITGENLGQVSSQTLQNLTVITKNIGLEIFRPVLTFDKQEIIDEAKKIGTYEISAGPEICNLLGPKHPATHAREEDIRRDLEKLDIPKLIESCVEKAEIIS